MASLANPKKMAKLQSLSSQTPRRLKREALDFGVLNGHLGYFLHRLQIELFKDFIGSLSAFDLRPAQYSVLVLIGTNPGRSQMQIGDALNIERARLTKMLNELETREWVQRLPAVNDGRSHALFLTVEGKKSLDLIKTLASNHETHVARLIGQKRRRQLMELLKDFG